MTKLPVGGESFALGERETKRTREERKRTWAKVQKAKRVLKGAKEEHAAAVRADKAARAEEQQLKEAMAQRVRDRVECRSCGRIGPSRPAVCWYCNASLVEAAEAT